MESSNRSKEQIHVTSNECTISGTEISAFNPSPIEIQVVSF